jgi:hypothetical protein
MSDVVEETNTFAFTGPTNAVSLSNRSVVNVTPGLAARVLASAACAVFTMKNRFLKPTFHGKSPLPPAHRGSWSARHES